ncbi:cobalt ABC transporter permease [bacterium]|nr:cobalt ABC transporter permease [bacterium]
MHISDGVLSPTVSLATGALAAAGIGECVRRLRRQGTEESPRIGLVAAFVFAAQMVNFPLGIAPVSGHLMGGTLAAVLLGPWGGGLAIAAVLIVQSVLMGDGAITALGANWLNMGLIGSVAAYPVFLFLSARARLGTITGAMLAAWVSVIVSSAAFSIELGFSNGFGGVGQILTWMVLVHAVIAVGEALITGLVLRGVMWSEPDLIDTATEASTRPAKRDRIVSWVGGIIATCAVVILLAPLASAYPDGLEYVGEQFGFLPAEAEASEPSAPLPDYSVPGMVEGRWSTVAAGLIGSVTVLIAGQILTRSLAARRLAAHIAATTASEGPAVP